MADRRGVSEEAPGDALPVGAPPVDAPPVDAPRRTFFALWPEGAVLERLAGVAAAAATRLGARPVCAADLHLTLQFLGKTSSAQVGALCAASSGLARAGKFQACGFSLERVEYWPGSRTLSLISANRPDSALALVAALVAQSASLGIAKPGAGWVPHVTLAQVPKAQVPKAGPKEPVAADWVLAEPVLWRASRFCLAESLDGARPDQPRYRILERWIFDPGLF